MHCKVWPEANYIFKKWKFIIITASFLSLIIFTKAVRYNELPKMKRDTQQKKSPFLKENCFFVRSLSSFSAICHNITLLAAVLKTVLKSTQDSWTLNFPTDPNHPKSSQISPNLRFCFITRARHRTFLKGVWPDYLFKILLQCNDMDISKGDAAVKPE